MNVLVISPGQDTGGQGIRIKEAFARHAHGWNVRAMHVSDTYLRYPRDMRYEARAAQRLYDAADVVHHKNTLGMYARHDNGQHKPAILHHQGTRLRDNAYQMRRECRSIGAVSLVSTVDLEVSDPDGAWLPTPYDLDALRDYRAAWKPSRPIRIAHAPTERRIKGTQAILMALDRLSQRHDIEVDIIENVPWKVCLSRKAQADIFVDQLILGYGNNAVEAWGMGIPVVAGVVSPQVRERMVAHWGEMPFYEATAEDVEQRLEEMIVSKALRDEWGIRGLAHARQYHDEAIVVNQLKAIYENAPPTKGTLKLSAVKAGPRQVSRSRPSQRKTGMEGARV